MIDKRAMRRNCFAAIKSLSPEYKAGASEAICQHIMESPAFRDARVVFSYLSLPGEPDLSTLSETHPEKTWAFSRVRTDGERLAFHEVQSPDLLREGDYGFLEPDPKICPEVATPDLVLVPGVGFDPSNGARLGRGKGHYDRFLSPHRGKVAVFGICFAVQISELEPESHDIPMDAVFCEDGRFPH